jgi:hypothetical protein
VTHVSKPVEPYVSGQIQKPWTHRQEKEMIRVTSACQESCNKGGAGTTNNQLPDEYYYNRGKSRKDASNLLLSLKAADDRSQKCERESSLEFFEVVGR